MPVLRLLALAALLLLPACSLAPAAPGVTPTAETALAPTSAALNCDQLITRAIERVGTTCDALDRNQACYGNETVQVEFRDGAQDVFSAVGDIVPLANLSRIRTSSLDELAQQWGVAVIKAQANLEGTLPGQNVTFLLFGDAQMDNPTPDMRAVRISTGIGQVECEGAPPSAVMVQSPNGTSITLNINGADLTVSSTVYITALANAEMTIATFEGSAVVEAFGQAQTVLPGNQVSLALGDEDGLEVLGVPSEPEPLDTTGLDHLPLTLLERPVVLPSPIAETPVPVTVTRPAATRAPATATRAAATVTPTTRPTLAPTTTTACTPRPDWTATYVIQSGDTLSRIAQRYGVTMTEIQQANCIGNPDLVSAGQRISVPMLVSTATATEPPATDIPTEPNLRADATTLKAGDCTTIRWDVTVVSAVYFEGQPTTDRTREVCPTETNTYTLLIVARDDTQESYSITLTVEQAEAVCGNQVCEDSEDRRSCSADCTPP